MALNIIYYPLLYKQCLKAKSHIKDFIEISHVEPLERAEYVLNKSNN
jgi:hypothetical protein